MPETEREVEAEKDTLYWVRCASCGVISDAADEPRDDSGRPDDWCPACGEAGCISMQSATTQHWPRPDIHDLMLRERQRADEAEREVDKLRELLASWREEDDLGLWRVYRAMWEHSEREVERLREALEEATVALRHAHVRDHEHSDGCAGCGAIDRVLYWNGSPPADHNPRRHDYRRAILPAMSEMDDMLRRGRLRRRLRTEPAYARYVRERAGLTQVELAELLGVSQGSVSHYELGRRVPGPDVLSRYADVLERLEAAS